MDEYINKRDLLDYAKKFAPLGIAREHIELFPTADVVEVVRCEDCKHGKS